MVEIKINLLEIYKESSDASTVQITKNVEESIGSTMFQWISTNKDNYIFPINKSRYFVSDNESGGVTIYFLNQEIYKIMNECSVEYSLGIEKGVGTERQKLFNTYFF